MELKILQGNNLELLKQYPDNYFDSCVTDSPYGLGKEPNALKLLQDWIDHGYHEIKGTGFMGKHWDAFVPQPLFWKEIFRVLKPGGYVLAFFGTRTYDWGTMAIRLAGFEIRDMITWMYGSGFPKSLDISKQIDKREPRKNMYKLFSEHFKLQLEISKIKISELFYLFPHYKNTESLIAQFSNWKLGKNVPSIIDFNILQPILNLSFEYMDLINRIETERILIRKENRKNSPSGIVSAGRKSVDFERKITIATADTAKKWDGWGTALKPASEPICIARKPIEKGLTVAENVLKYGTGGINIDGCRVEFETEFEDTKRSISGFNDSAIYGTAKDNLPIENQSNRDNGRFPSNVILDDFMGNELDEQTGVLTSGTRKAGNTLKSDNEGNKLANIYGKYKLQNYDIDSNSGGASRFFYCAKTSQEERHLGCEDLKLKDPACVTDFSPSLKNNPENWSNGTETPYTRTTPTLNNHPTVKPIALMRYLQRLVTPKGGKTLDPYAGSGTSGCSAYFEDIGEIVLMEMDETYIPIIEARTTYWSKEVHRKFYLEELKRVKEEVPENQMKLF